MRIPRKTDPILSAMFLCSVSTHYIYQRRLQIEEKQRLTAHRSILRGIYYRLKNGECIGAAEYTKLMALTGTSESVPRSPLPSECRDHHGTVVASWSNLFSGWKLPKERSQDEMDKEIWSEWERALQSEEKEQSRIQSMEKGSKSVDVSLIDTEHPDAEPSRTPPSPSQSTPSLGTRRATLYI